MKKKVGLVTCYFKHNYGSMLQAYATKKILDDNNIPNETINIEANIDFQAGKKKYYLSQIFNQTFIKSKLGMIKLRLDKKLNKNLGKNLSLRDQKYEEFKQKFNLSPPYTTYQELTEACRQNYSSVIVGSDQLWLPVNVVADYYTLNFVPDNLNKISYATSFGVSVIPHQYKDLYQKFLSRLNFISVREDRGAGLVSELSGLEAQVVCDPTMLLTKDQWDEVATPQRIIKDDYILCYFLGKDLEYRKFAERLRAKTHCKIVSLNHCDEYVKYSDQYADIIPYDIGPSEWINLIKHAQYVCTDSFHGTVFSLLYHKTFFTFRRYKEESKVSTNNRIKSLLSSVSLEERLLDGTEDIDSVLDLRMDYQKVNQKIVSFRKESQEFLMNAITGKEK